MRKQLFILLTIHILTSLLSVSMLAFRIAKVDAAYFLFLVWNLFLAWLPFGFATTAVILRRLPLFPIAFGALWLLFLPNAPYIITDLIHLRWVDGVPLWYDLTMFLSFATTGLLLGFTSLNLMHNLVEERFGRIVGWAFVGVTMGLCGYGIYLGRFLRWNSWDIVTNPFGLLGDMFIMLRYPRAHIESYAITAVFAIIFLTAYITITTIGSMQKAAATPDRH